MNEKKQNNILSVDKENAVTPQYRSSKNMHQREENISISPFSGRARRKPIILSLLDSLENSFDVSSVAEANSQYLYTYWSIDNLLFAELPEIDVVILGERYLEYLRTPIFGKISKFLMNKPILCVRAAAEKNSQNAPSKGFHGERFYREISGEKIPLKPLKGVKSVSAAPVVSQYVDSNLPAGEILEMAVNLYHRAHDEELSKEASQSYS